MSVSEVDRSKRRFLVAVTSAVPLAYPVLVVVIVAVELVLGATPVMVAKPELPEPVTTTEPDAVTVPAHV